jgi:hypothetical protein
VALFAGRFMPFVLNGLLVSLYAFAIGVIFLGVRLAPGSLAVAGLALLVTVFSCTAIGALQGAVSLRLRDGLFGANLVTMSILLFCGVNIPLRAARLDGVIGNLLPFTHGLEAVRQAADGAGRRGRRADRDRGAGRDRVRRRRIRALRLPGAIGASQRHFGRAVTMTLRRVLSWLLALVVVAGLGYTGYVGYEGSRQLIEAGGSHRDCRTPDLLFGWTYEAINYDIADDALLQTGTPT